MSERLSSRTRVPAGVQKPAYEPEQHGVGIVHIGVGAFHKAHQAVYTDTAIAAAGGDWRILGVSLRSPEAAEALNPQDGRYTLLTRDEKGGEARLIGSISKVLVAPQARPQVIEAIARHGTRIVTLTVTEKAYGFDRKNGGLDEQHEAVAHDLTNRDEPRGVIGLLVAGLAHRRLSGGTGLTVLCCDNLPENGTIVRRLVLEFAARTDAGLADWIEAHVRFPSSMVDRITPAATAATLSDAASACGAEDRAAVETEPFTQWIVEDDFIAGRPAWERAGALFVDDVAPYEKMKLRLLNGTHSLIAYAGFLAGYETVADAMADQHLVALARSQMQACAQTLPPVPGVDLDAHREALLARFSNRAIRHLTYQIAMDGTQKLPQRILAPLAETIRRGDDPRPLSFCLAAWMRYCLGHSDQGERYDLRDPREAEIFKIRASAGREPVAIYDALSLLEGLFPDDLACHAAVRDQVIADLKLILDIGMRKAIAARASA